MHKRVRAFTLAISLCHIGFANAQTDQSECQEAIGRYGRASKEIWNMLDYMANAYGIVAVGLIARVSSVPSKMIKTTLKKQFLDIAEVQTARMTAAPAPELHKVYYYQYARRHYRRAYRRGCFGGYFMAPTVPTTLATTVATTLATTVATMVATTVVISNVVLIA